MKVEPQLVRTTAASAPRATASAPGGVLSMTGEPIRVLRDSE
jgi:hypothetical protein